MPSAPPPNLPLKGGGTRSVQAAAQNLAALFPPLLIEAERIAHTVYQGTHGRRRAGSGETFWQFRRYEQGDPVERIDWRQSARTDKVYIREKEWEAAQTACLWADTSGSMQYASEKNLPGKAERARLLMLALASLCLNGGEKVVWLDRRDIAVHGKTGLAHIAARMGTGSHESLPPEVKLARNAQVVLCSDFLMSEEKLQQLMRRYTSLHLKGILMHILDPAEENFDFHGRLELQGCEQETPLLLPNAAALQDAYQKRLAEHKDMLNHAAKSAGWHYTRHVTSELPHLALLRLYQFLSADHRSF